MLRRGIFALSSYHSHRLFRVQSGRGAGRCTGDATAAARGVRSPAGLDQNARADTLSARAKHKIMTITSSAFEEGAVIPAKYTCDGENINPPLTISDMPPETKGLTLIMDDPDASMGTWVHWTIWNIPATTTEIPESTSSPGIEGVTSFGKPGYGGPCPPNGDHRYFFRLFALDIALVLPTQAKRSDLDIALQGHILAKAELMGRYQRQQ